MLESLKKSGETGAAADGDDAQGTRDSLMRLTADLRSHIAL